MGPKEAKPPRGKEETEGEEGGRGSPSLQRPPHPPEIKAVHSQHKITPALGACEDPARSEITLEQRATEHVMEFIMGVF